MLMMLHGYLTLPGMSVERRPQGTGAFDMASTHIPCGEHADSTDADTQLWRTVARHTA
jgi:hypothetical protein